MNNRHNTCFANAVLQCLRVATIHGQGEWAQAIRRVFGARDCYDLCRAVSRTSSIVFGEHNDACEFYMALIERLVEEDRRNADMFVSRCVDKMQCLACGVTRRTEYDRLVWFVCPDGPGPHSLSSMMRVDAETVSAVCDRCKHNQAKIVQFPTTFPHVLAISIASPCALVKLDGLRIGDVDYTLTGAILHAHRHYVAIVREDRYFLVDDVQVIDIGRERFLEMASRPTMLFFKSLRY